LGREVRVLVPVRMLTLVLYGVAASLESEMNKRERVERERGNWTRKIKDLLSTSFRSIEKLSKSLT
jgi:hypothetical protein